jgi:hypothetical protein
MGMDLVLLVIVVVLLVVAVSFARGWLTFAQRTRSRIVRARQMAATARVYDGRL